MKNLFCGLLVVWGLAGFRAAAEKKPLTYTVDLRQPRDDLFHVEVEVTDVGEANAVYQFAATAPGTYQVMDIGRYVRSFEAFDRKGKKLPVEQISTNQWKLGKPGKTARLRYTVAETWDTEVKQHRIYRMCGTSMERDHVLLNGQGVFGYFTGQQDRPLRIRLQHPGEWLAGTALEQDGEGYYRARSYDHVVDSPVLLGRLTKASTQVGGTEVALFCYSKTDVVKADQLLGGMQQMLEAARAFLVKLPVDRYVFLYHFEDVDNGAWEHSYSSEYVLAERPLDEELLDGIVSTAAHEFFHIVTPLNLHSEVIGNFNFVNPTGSQHLWLYEGVTEWASDLMQLRGGLMDLEDYCDELRAKVEYDHYQDTTYSLVRLGLMSFEDEGQQQYSNIYHRGAVTAALLDLRLLELSGGKRGLREVLLELTRRYGPSKPFREEGFFQEFVQITYPEISEFFARYVQQAEPLPLSEYFGKVGIRYARQQRLGRQLPSLGLALTLTSDGVRLTHLGDSARAFGFREGDELVRAAGEAVERTNVVELLKKVKEPGIGKPFELTVRRGDGREYTIGGRIQAREETKDFSFWADPAATPQQLALRQAWMRNL